METTLFPLVCSWVALYNIVFRVANFCIQLAQELYSGALASRIHITCLRFQQAPGQAIDDIQFGSLYHAHLVGRIP
jgi:hypothetical protein